AEDVGLMGRPAALLSSHGFGHILKYTPFTLALSALHLTLSNAAEDVGLMGRPAALLSSLGFGHILKYTLFSLALSALHLKTFLRG
ncbi:hypothetical protein, partial [Porphyromonas loveana]|uniref:hypothetical protein n=3 Tax=Porphyromonas loveana TaxID=1884669 RepID=UPI00359FC35B